MLLFLPINAQSELSLPVPSSAWCLNLALGYKGSIFFHINQILGTLDFTIFTGSEHRALFNFQSTDIQIVGKAQRKARATPHYLNDWYMLRAHCQELSMIWCSVGSTIKMMHWHLSVHRLLPAWLVSSQALSSGIAVPGRETQRSLQARLVLLAL